MKKMFGLKKKVTIIPLSRGSAFSLVECNLIILYNPLRKVDTFSIVIIKQEPSSKNKIQIKSRNWTCSSLHST